MDILFVRIVCYLLLLTFIDGSTPNELLEGNNKTTPSPLSGCPELDSKCRCHFQLTFFSVNCFRLEELDEVTDIMRLSFANVTIGLLSISNSSFAEVTARAFSNLTIQDIYLRRVRIGKLSDDAFADVDQLTSIRLKQVTGFQTIPNAVAQQNVSTLSLTSGSLTSVGTQLQNMTFLSDLRLANNRIRFVHPEAFSNCISLTKVVLSNNLISVIYPEIFSSCIPLQLVDLSNNLIQGLNETTFLKTEFLRELYLENNLLSFFRGVIPSPMLEWLNLSNNSFKSVKDIFDKPFPNLETLHLNHNPLNSLSSQDLRRKFPKLVELELSNTSLHTIGDGAFSDIRQLQKLLLNNNTLTELPNNAFPGSLRELHLNNNLLTNISGKLTSMDNLFILFLSNNNITNLEGIFDFIPNLRKLSLESNQIEKVPNGSFANFPRLQSLYLPSNQIRDLENGSFLGLKQQLQILDLSNNYIESLGGAFSDSRTLPLLRKLSLYGNNLQYLSWNDFSLENLHKLNLGQNNISRLDQAFSQLRNLFTLNILKNRLEIINRQNFPKTIALRSISLQDNPLTCDCRLLWLVESIRSKHHHHIGIDHLSQCMAPDSLKGQYLHHLTVGRLTNWTDDCPKQCSSCRCYPRRGNITIYVDCQRRNLTSVPLHFPRYVTLLNLSDNAIDALPGDMQQFLPNLETLDLRRNGLRTLDGVRFPSGLRSLNVSQNNLTTFPLGILSNLNLTDVRLSVNPWMCDCDADSFRSWILKNFETVT